MPLSSKATLSAALAKARTAVQLDQAEYHDGAKRYYVEVVELLGRVIVRASSENDIKKLKDIVSLVFVLTLALTYSTNANAKC